MPKSKPLKEKIIVALDVDRESKAKKLVNLLSRHVKIFKVGSILFTQSGPSIIKYVQKKNCGVFLDLKFFDISNTVANAVRQAVRLKVKMLTLHISGGDKMLESAVAAAKDESKRLNIKKPLLIGVTVLTSKDAKPKEVLHLAKLGLSCGLDGVVCSANEAAMLRRKIKQKFIIVTPGIRQKDAKRDDQKRTATAKEALRAGSNYLVVGRPIVKAEDPVKAVKEMI
ncbi:MAG: orotidine-5'-phosphate decarboxylase [Candidatus Omnitrophica bacterium]|nr:orotidine-5'-phosphate decarboxylase [Candidatus Omnitrophota bacterium]